MIYHSILDDGAARNILHIIDTCTRYGQSVEIEGKDEQTLCNALSTHWLMIFGSPEVITMDGERSLHSLYAADWAEANNVQMRCRAPHQHAWIVERHNA
eukprot:1208299-Amphidinium_carterae.1